MSQETVSTMEVEKAAQKIAQAKNLVTFSGAGLSAESGIATFRDKNTDALWSKFDPAKLASQEGFSENPERVIDWYNARRETLAQAKPNPAHVALSGSGAVHITQNVDNLLESAGATDVLHLHGSLLSDHCNAGCGYTETVDLANSQALRKCPQCGKFSNSYMRPSVVWFGEPLPDAVMQRAIDAASNADVLLVVGTSAAVYPAAGLIPIAAERGAFVIVVNTEASGASCNIELLGKAGDILPQVF